MIGAPALCPWTPLCPPRSELTADAQVSGWVGSGLSLCMWHQPLPLLAPLVSSGQGAGRGEEGWGGASAQEHRDTGHEGHQGAEKGGSGQRQEGETL